MYRGRVWIAHYRWAWLDRLLTQPVHDGWYRTFEAAVIRASEIAGAAPPGCPVRADVRQVR